MGSVRKDGLVARSRSTAELDSVPRCHGTIVNILSLKLGNALRRDSYSWCSNMQLGVSVTSRRQQVSSIYVS